MRQSNKHFVRGKLVFFVDNSLRVSGCISVTPQVNEQMSTNFLSKIQKLRTTDDIESTQTRVYE